MIQDTRAASAAVVWRSSASTAAVARVAEMRDAISTLARPLSCKVVRAHMHDINHGPEASLGSNRREHEGDEQEPHVCT